MKLLGTILVACVLLSVLQVALSVLLVIGLIVLLFGVFYHPAETFGFLAFGLFANLLQSHPLAGASLLGLFVTAGIVLPKGASSRAMVPSAPETNRASSE